MLWHNRTKKIKKRKSLLSISPTTWTICRSVWICTSTSAPPRLSSAISKETDIRWLPSSRRSDIFLSQEDKLHFISYHFPGESTGFLQGKFLFRAGETVVLCWWNCCFMLVKLLFRTSGTFIFCWWNFCFQSVELLFHPGGTAVSCRKHRRILCKKFPKRKYYSTPSIPESPGISCKVWFKFFVKILRKNTSSYKISL